MKLQLINDINTLKSTDNATQIELAVVDEQQQFIDLSQFEMILVNIGSGGALYSSETPVVNEDGNTFSFTLSQALPVGKYQIQVHLTTHDGKLHIAPHKGVETLTIEKSFNEVSGETIAVISIQKLLDDMASTLSVAEAANDKANDAVAKAESAISTANIATTDAATAVTIANEAKAESATANEAKAVADDAKEIADDANVKATQATNDASNAVQTANTASDNATQAVNTANDAKSLATDADSKSDSAVATANKANDKSSTAVDTANTASDAAGNALTIAQQANDTANSADAKATDAVTTANNTIAIASDANDKANDAVTKAENASNTAESVRAEFDALTTGNTDAELIAARTDESSTTHETLKTRIDSEAIKRANGDVNTLQSAKDYVDGKVGNIDLSELSTKDETSAAVQFVKDYADTQTTEALQDAKDYTNSKIGDIDFSTFVTKEPGKNLSTNDYTDDDRIKLASLKNVELTDTVNNSTTTAITPNAVKGALSSVSADTAFLQANIIDLAIELETTKNAELNGVNANIAIETFLNLNDVTMERGVYSATNKWVEV